MKVPSDLKSFVWSDDLRISFSMRHFVMFRLLADKSARWSYEPMRGSWANFIKCCNFCWLFVASACQLAKSVLRLREIWRVFDKFDRIRTMSLFQFLEIMIFIKNLNSGHQTTKFMSSKVEKCGKNSSWFHGWHVYLSILTIHIPVYFIFFDLTLLRN